MIDAQSLRLVIQGEDAASPALETVSSAVESLSKESNSTAEKVRGLGESFVQLAAMAAGMPAPLAKAFGKLANLPGTVTGNIARAIENLERMKDKVKNLFESIKKAGVWAFDKVKKAASWAFNKMKNLITSVGQGILNLVKKLGLLAVAILGVSLATGGLQKAFSEMFDLKGAARLEGINNAFLAIAGEGAPALRAAMKLNSAGMIEWEMLAGRYIDATLLINKQVADELPEALTYLTKISLATGESMDYLIDSLVRGVGRLSPKILDNLKIQVSLAEVVARACEMFGKEATALSIVEKQTAMMTLAMEKLESKTRDLADPTGSLVALMQRYKVVTSENAKLLASHFIPVARSYYQVMNKLADAFTRSISEGGKWYNVLRKISATISVVIDLVGDLADKFADAGADSVDAFANKMFEAAWSAFSWGANIVNNLAIGITRGATTALISAINFISNILSYWMAPGSAPRFLPQLVDWGSAAFTEYLKGFSDAEFGVLIGVQAPLRGALQALVGLGMMAQEEVGPVFIGLSEKMAAALIQFAETGQVSESIFAELATVGGGYGEQLEELFRRQLAVAQATNEVEDAERRLVQARQDEEVAGKQLSRQAREYNRLLRSGASAEALKAKLAEVKASYATLENAREEADLAEGDKKSAQERAKEANKLMTLQTKLLQQLVDMGQAMSQYTEAADEAGAPDLLPDLIPDLAPVVSNIDQAFQDLKDRIRARFLELGAELKAAWIDSGVFQLVDELIAWWDNSLLKEWWEEFILDVEEEGLRTALENLWLKLEVALQNWMDDKHPVLGDIWRAFTEEGVEDGSGKVDFKAAWDAVWATLWDGFLNMLDPQEDVPDQFKGSVEGWTEDGSRKVSFLIVIDTLWTKLKKGILSLSFRFGRFLANTIFPLLQGDEEGSFWHDLGKSFVAGLLLGFTQALREKWQKWHDLANAIKDFFKDAFGTHSDSTVFATIGRDLVAGLFHGFSDRLSEIDWAHMGRTIRDRISSGFTGFGEAIKGAFNGVINTIERAVDNIITGINQMIWRINNLPGGWGIPYVDYIDFPRLDKGGLVTATEQLAVLHSQEVILPLDDPATQALLAGAMRAAAVERPEGSRNATPVVIHNHFGQGSVRSDQDVIAIVDAVQRSLELRGIRGRIS